MDAKKFKEGFFNVEKINEANKLVGSLTVEQATILYNASEIVKAWTGLDMRQEYYQALLKNRMEKK